MHAPGTPPRRAAPPPTAPLPGLASAAPAPPEPHVIARTPGYVAAHAVPRPVAYDLSAILAVHKPPEELRRLPRALRDFYNDQNELIGVYTRVSLMERPCTSGPMFGGKPYPK